MQGTLVAAPVQPSALRASLLASLAPSFEPRPFSYRRMLAVGGLLAPPAALLVYGTLSVPVRAPVLLAGEARGHWPVAALAALVVVAVDAAWLIVLLRRRAAPPSPRAALMVPPIRPGRASLAALAVLRPELVPSRVIAITAATSAAMLAAAAVMAFPLWVIAALTIAPWLPLLSVEGLAKYQHYGCLALFGAITLLQIGHLGEHTTQVSQLLMRSGDLSRARGVFGQLDFETVHFVWDTGIWLGLGLLLYRFGARNPWLWICFAAASLHEVEHIYLFSVYRSDLAFYTRGGLAGVMGSGGVVGSPLGRPYLHFAYNVCVVIPMVIAFWDQSRQVLADSVARLSSGVASQRR
ncbi:MAG: hypothetical protein E6J14_03295 [Chloroflexi bacterium]|nr:MAG: hypothetical protein E6J14_03295 [Chloroflexota bacterium]